MTSFKPANSIQNRTGGTAPSAVKAAFIQPKLTVNSPGDVYEQEADAMAGKVMSGRPSTGMVSTGMIGSSVQRKCAHCEEEEKNKKDESLRRKADGSSGGFAASPQLTSRLGSARGGGMPLPAATRSYMENAFSRDFSQVRVHADSGAHDMSRSIQAKAFTHGNDLYFNSGQYQPDTSEGQRLLAHELTHVVQQEGGRSSQLQREIELRPPGKGEFSAFDRANELIDRLNTVHPAAITYSLDSNNKIQCTVVEDGEALSHFDSEMKKIIDDTDILVPLRLISKHGLARPSGNPGGGLEPVIIDDYESGYVDLDDLLASEGVTFQMNLIHFLKERFVTKNYKDRLGSQIPQAEFDKAHAAGRQEEVEVLRDLFGDQSIKFASEDRLSETNFQFVYFSHDEKYTIFMFLKSPTRALTKSSIRVRPAGKKKLLTVDEFLEERNKTKAAAPAPTVQPKLTVNTPGDRYEQEADAMADKVMRKASVQAPVQHAPSSLQRKCAQCETEDKKDGLMRKAEGGGGFQASPTLASKLETNKGAGSLLPDGTRHFMENAFSADFSRVSIHNNSEAAEMSRGIGAHAFTHGNDIYFNSGRYSPHTGQGQRLLAHELTHTLQQTGGIHRSTGAEAGSGSPAPTGGTAGGTGTGTGATGGISVDVLAATNPEDFLVRAAAQELGTDIRVGSMENMIDQLESLVPASGCLSSLNIYNHGNPSVQVVSGGSSSKVKNADGTTSQTPISGFSLNWLSTATNQGALNRLRHLFCCNGTINWFGCSTVGVWAEGGTRTETERTSDAHRYTGPIGDWYQSIPEALARGAFESFRYIGAINAQMWADATCTNLTAATDFTNWTTQDGRVTRTTAHGGGRFRYQPRTVAGCTCDTTTNRVSGAAASATALETSAAQLREDWLRPHYERYRSVLGRTPTPPAETAAQAQERQRRATEMQALGQTIRTAVLDRAGIAAGASPTTSAEALQIVGRWGITVTDMVSRMGPLAAATGARVSGTTSGGSLDSQQRTLEAALTPRGRDTFMAMMAHVQQERFWADHFATNTIYVFPDLPPTARYRAYKQEGTRPLPGGGTAPVYIIHMKKDMIDGGQSELATALLVHELSHTLFHGITGEAMSGFLDELANLIVDDPQIVALRGSSATPADRDRQARQIRQLIYDASAYAEEEIFVHLQQLTHMPSIDEGGRALSGPTYIRERVTDFMHQLFQIGLPPAALRQVITNLAVQTRSLYQRRIESMPAGSNDRRLLELNRQLAISTLQLAYDEVRNPGPATP